MQGFEKGDAESSGVGPVFESATKNQTQGDDAFLETWMRAIALEEQGIATRRAQMWTVPGETLAK